MIFIRNGSRIYVYECNTSFGLTNAPQMTRHHCDSMWKDYTRQAGTFKCNKCPQTWRFSPKSVKRIIPNHTRHNHPSERGAMYVPPTNTRWADRLSQEMRRGCCLICLDQMNGEEGVILLKCGQAGYLECMALAISHQVWKDIAKTIILLFLLIKFNLVKRILPNMPRSSRAFPGRTS